MFRGSMNKSEFLLKFKCIKTYDLMCILSSLTKGYNWRTSTKEDVAEGFEKLTGMYECLRNISIDILYHKCVQLTNLSKEDRKQFLLKLH